MYNSKEKFQNLLDENTFEEADFETTEKYVVSIDSIPQFYTSTKKESIDLLWNMVQKLQFEYPSHSSFIHIPFSLTPEIHLISCSKLFLISYDTLIHKLQVHKISHL